MRFTRGDMRDHIVSHPNRSGTSVLALRSIAVAETAKKSTFARFLTSLDFRLLQQYRRKAAVRRTDDHAGIERLVDIAAVPEGEGVGLSA